jgi:hypothetical protein
LPEGLGREKKDVNMWREFGSPPPPQKSEMAGFHVRRDDDEQTAGAQQWLNVSQQSRGGRQVFDHIVHYNKVCTRSGEVTGRQCTIQKRDVGVLLTRPRNPGLRNVYSNDLLPALASELGTEPTLATAEIYHTGPWPGEFG